MVLYTLEEEIEYLINSNHKSGELINSYNGAKNEFSMGLSFYTAEHFGTPGRHHFQEAFYVLEGIGEAKIGDEIFTIKPGTSFIAQAGVQHSIKKSPPCECVKVLWCHGAV